ncbi:hypothetical protein [Bdellovibrio sp. KM01]|uniref:hypothetical protein n=1 Tax=Bdellovibrio sp. KM01 TaxID=2748865 RepID=UPI0015E9E2D1|nr:hypothetical protein [Bdellovibrio sp. KM01]QLY25008.1 hypothetical protein HW988_16510 [Bdellovibrio sp. KM01]
MKLVLAMMSFLIGMNAFAQTAATPAAASAPQETRMKRPVLIPKLNQLQLYPLAMDIRYEKDSADNYIEQKPQNLSFAYRTNAWSVLFEYSKFTEESGNPTLNIKRDHEEMLLWGRWHLWRLQKKSMRVSVYGGGSLGTYKEDVTTTLSGTSQKDSTGGKFLSGLAAGADISYDFTKYFGVIAAAEGRGLIGQELDPNPTFGGVIRTGIYYAW